MEELQQELEKVKKEAQDYLDGWKRAKADYINFKNDQDKRSRELAQFAGLSTVMQVLPAMESFRMAFAHMPAELQGTDWVKGIEQVYKQLADGMKMMGVEQETDLVGTSFDPSRHEAVAHESDPSKPEGQIIKEVNAGYSVHGRVVIPAKVVVNTISNS